MLDETRTLVRRLELSTSSYGMYHGVLKTSWRHAPKLQGTTINHDQVLSPVVRYFLALETTSCQSCKDTIRKNYGSQWWEIRDNSACARYKVFNVQLELTYNTWHPLVWLEHIPTIGNNHILISPPKPQVSHAVEDYAAEGSTNNHANTIGCNHRNQYSCKWKPVTYWNVGIETLQIAKSS